MRNGSAGCLPADFRRVQPLADEDQRKNTQQSAPSRTSTRRLVMCRKARFQELYNTKLYLADSAEIPALRYGISPKLMPCASGSAVDQFTVFVCRRM